MTQETFIKTLEAYDIKWNDVVEITVFNPKYKWWHFGINKLITITGAIDFTDYDSFIRICSEEFNDNLFKVIWDDAAFYAFDFNEIVSIKKLSKKNFVD